MTTSTTTLVSSERTVKHQRPLIRTPSGLTYQHPTTGLRGICTIKARCCKNGATFGFRTANFNSGGADTVMESILLICR